MRYYKYPDEYSPIGGMTYVETEAGWTIRQLTVRGNQMLASNVAYPRWGLMLADQRVEFDDIDEVTPISKAEFDQVWQTHLAQHTARWTATKTTYPIGTSVTGVLRVFYPQGVIVEIGNNVLGVADHAAVRAGSRPDWLYPRSIMTAIVAGYDEINYWLVLTSPHLTGEHVAE